MVPLRFEYQDEYFEKRNCQSQILLSSTRSQSNPIQLSPVQSGECFIIPTYIHIASRLDQTTIFTHTHTRKNPFFPNSSPRTQRQEIGIQVYQIKTSHPSQTKAFSFLPLQVYLLYIHGKSPSVPFSSAPLASELFTLAYHTIPYRIAYRIVSYRRIQRDCFRMLRYRYELKPFFLFFRPGLRGLAYLRLTGREMG